MTKNTDHSENANGSNSTNLAETTNFVRGALDRFKDEAAEPSCQAFVSETGHYILEDPSNGDAWIRTQNIKEVRC